MNNKFLLFVSIIIIAVVVAKNSVITDKLSNIISQDFEVEINNTNEYAKEKGYELFEDPKNNVPLSYKELVGIIYKSVNAKQEKVSFYCPSEYNTCLNDIKSISENALLLTHLNNYVHPYNSFHNLKTTISETGEITLDISYVYNQEEINELNDLTNKILNEQITDDMEEYDKIKAIHDYIINNTKYDIARNETGESKYDSYKATGVLKDGYGTCNGYADTMAIFLTKLGYDNYKIATTPEEITYQSTGHVWNAINFDNKWLHIDLTWDDPVSDDGKDYLYHKYFLVTTEEMHEADAGDVNIEEHNFDNNIYLEFK